MTTQPNATTPTCQPWCDSPNGNVFSHVHMPGECWNTEVISTEAEGNAPATTISTVVHPAEFPGGAVLLEKFVKGGLPLTPREARRLAGALNRAAANLDNHPAGTKLHTQKELPMNTMPADPTLQARGDISIPASLAANTSLPEGFTIKAGEVTLIAGRPARGKTELCIKIALEAAIRQEKSVVLHTLEGTASSVMDRVLAYESAIDLTRLSNKKLNKDDWEAIARSVNKLENTDFDIIDDCNVGPTDIAASVVTTEPDLVIVDYLDLMRSHPAHAAGVETRQGLMQGLQMVAEGMGVAIVCAVQLPKPQDDHTCQDTLARLGLGSAEQVVIIDPSGSN